MALVIKNCDTENYYLLLISSRKMFVKDSLRIKAAVLGIVALGAVQVRASALGWTASVAAVVLPASVASTTSTTSTSLLVLKITFEGLQ